MPAGRALAVVTATLLLATAAITIAALVQGTIGFGMALLTAPILVLIDPAFVPVALLVSSVPLSALVAWRERHHVDTKGLPWALAGRVIGTLAGAGAVVALPLRTLQLIVAVCVLVAVAASVAVRVTVTPGPVKLSIVGAISGFMGTTAAIGGPPMALLYQHAAGARIRATLAVYFLFGTTLSLAALALAGAVSLHALVLTIVLVPGTGLGFWFSGRLRARLDRGWMRPAVLGTAAVSAVVLLASAAG